MSLSLLGGELKIVELTVANPEGFSDRRLMQSGRFELHLRPASVFTDTIELRRFELDGLEINIEQRLAGSNVGKVIDNLKRLASDDAPAESEGEGKKIKVARISIKNVVANFYLLPDLAPGGPLTVKLPEIELTDVASGDEGVTVSELVSRLMTAILAAVFEKSEGIVPNGFLKDVSGQLTDLAEALGSEVEKLAEQAGKQLEADLKKVETDLKKAGEDVEKGVQDALKNILKPKDESKQP